MSGCLQLFWHRFRNTALAPSPRVTTTNVKLTTRIRSVEHRLLSGSDLVVCPPLFSSGPPPLAQVRLRLRLQHTHTHTHTYTHTCMITSTQTPSVLPEHPCPNRDNVHPDPIRSALSHVSAVPVRTTCRRERCGPRQVF